LKKKELTMQPPKSLVDAEWLKANLENPEFVIVDATVHLPDTGRNAKEEYAAEHIPGARFFDLDVIADPDNPRPRKIPPLDRFNREVGKLGVSNGKHVIAYDTRGLYSAARVWWLFRHYGYDKVSVLDGGLVSWKMAGGPVECGAVEGAASTFNGIAKRGLLALKADVLEESRSGGQILDARTPGRWAGTEIDRYPGARAGRIPGSTNLYWEDLLDKNDRTFVTGEALREKFEKTGISLDRPITISCGSGLTACILALGLSNIGKDDWRIYDGSWDEWGRDHDLPIESDA
jgi:thiosulfate/3-mercaptopyruvate sulfurtransferase